nr:axonemal dynein light intermediate polypeptide 1-like [Parasteatoda tepidariorum]
MFRLQEALDNELVEQDAREMGICPVRRRLYDQLMEELVRQELVTCPERGRLLRMVQMECQLSLTSTVTGYESAVAYGLKKRLSSGQEASRLSSLVSESLMLLATLEQEVRELEPEIVKIREGLVEKEVAQQKELEGEEFVLKDENERILRQMMDVINISFDTEN